jgi:cytochrome c
MRNLRPILVAAAALAGLGLPLASQALDVDAALALQRQNNCNKCHHMERDKEGPSFRKIAEKYKGKPDAEAKLVTHLTTSPKVKLSDGTEEEHKVIATRPAKDMAQVKNLVQYILEQTKK